MTAPYLETLLDAAIGVQNGSHKPVGDKDELVIQVTGITAGEVVQIEGSNDEGLRPGSGGITNWTVIQFNGVDDITTDGFYRLPTTPNWIRANITAAGGSNPVTVKMKAQIT